MATRMQQRRGTASQWTSANPILNAGEIGWESDTNKFKIGDGTNHWENLDYFIDQSSTVNPSFGSSITFEGATADSYETTLQVTDPTADRTITFPDSTGTVALTSDITVTASSTNTFSNKSISLTSNTLSGTTAEFNAALSDSNFVTTGDTGTVTSTMIADGAIVNGDINASAAIAYSKLNLTGSITSSDITDGTIVDGDINASAAIAQSKISNLTTDLAAKASLSGATFTGAVSGTDLTLSGNLTVNGTTTNINSTNLVVEDKNIILADVETPSDSTANGGGITLKGTTDKTFNWVDSTDSWTSSEHLFLSATKELRLADTDSSHYVGFKAPGTVSTNKIWTLPSADGTTGQALVTDGSGTLSWAAAGGGGAAISELMLIGA